VPTPKIAETRPSATPSISWTALLALRKMTKLPTAVAIGIYQISQHNNKHHANGQAKIIPTIVLDGCKPCPSLVMAS
jgi:hypothetical protein